MGSRRKSRSGRHNLPSTDDDDFAWEISKLWQAVSVHDVLAVNGN
jgi:hypothetical protein